MSKSKKKPIIKDYMYKGCKSEYRRLIRRSINNQLRSDLLNKDLDDLVIKDYREIMDDYDWIEWIYNMKDCCGPNLKSRCSYWGDAQDNETKMQICKSCREKYSRK